MSTLCCKRIRWITESGNLEVDIAPCAGAALCGKVVRVLGSRSMSAPGTEMAAADAGPALGMTLLSGLRPTDGRNTEYRGEIYNRENAKTYRATFTPAEPGQLLVREMRANAHWHMNPVAFIDDDARKAHTWIGGVPVRGALDDLERIIRKYTVDEVILSSPSINGDVEREIRALCQRMERPVRRFQMEIR